MDTEIGLYYLVTRYYDPVTYRFINADGYFQTGQGFLDKNMGAYCLNNPVMRFDPTGTCSSFLCAGRGVCKDFLSFPKYDYSDSLLLLAKKNNFTPRKDSRKGSENRQPSGSRERNVGHENGEEHSRVPKGNGVKRNEAENVVNPSEFGWSLPSFSFDNFRENAGKIGDAINGIVNTGDPLQEAVWDIIHFFGG